MNGTRNIKILTLISISFLLLFFNVCSLTAAEISSVDQQIIDAGVKKAKELGLNPIPICEKDDGHKYIPRGFIFNISSGGFSLINGDMLINASKGTYTVVDVNLDRGEYAVMENDKIKKGEIKLISK